MVFDCEVSAQTQENMLGIVRETQKRKIYHIRDLALYSPEEQKEKARDLDNGNVVLIPVPCRPVPKRPPGVLYQYISLVLADIFWQLGTKASRCSPVQGHVNIIVAIKPSGLVGMVPESVRHSHCPDHGQHGQDHVQGAAGRDPIRNNRFGFPK